MANVDFYQNKLRQLMDDPSSFSGTPGYAFARDQALQASNRGNSAIRGGGAAMTELQDRASGLASQKYLSYLHELGGQLGQEQTYDLGQTKNANDMTLGTEQNRLTGVRDANSFDLGNRGLALDRYKTDQSLGLDRYKADQTNALGMTKIGADYALGHEANANTGQRDMWGYDIARRKDSLDQATAQNSYNLDADRNALGWYGAQTQRGSARSGSDLDWSKWNTARNPIRRIA